MYFLKKIRVQNNKASLFCLKKWLKIIVAGVGGWQEGKSVGAIEGCYWGPRSLQSLNDWDSGKTGGLHKWENPEGLYHVELGSETTRDKNGRSWSTLI